MSEHNQHGSGIGRGKVFVLAAILGIALGAAASYWGHERIAHFLGQSVAHNSDSPGEPAARQLWTCGMHPQVIQDHPGDCPICHMKLTPLKTQASGPVAEAGERRVLYWWDPMMNPPYISKEPGQSPMGMELVPVYADEAKTSAAVTIDPAVVQNMGLRTALVSEGPLHTSVRAVGYMVEAEPNIVDVNLRVNGWIEALQADTEGMQLERGDALFDLYSPEFQLSIEELISARKLRSTAAEVGDDFYSASASKLELLGLAPQEIERLAGLDSAPRTVRFTSPISGHLIEKHVVAGDSVQAGERVMRIVDHSTLWLDTAVYEQDQPFVHIGQSMTAQVASLPGTQFHGDVVFIHPHVDERTRAAKVRIAIANPDMLLRPGMFATAELDVQVAKRAVLVPREAVIDSGVQQLAFVDLGDGQFEPRRVKMGALGSDDMLQVLTGLAPGERVVVSGQFLIDTESRLAEAVQKFLSGSPTESVLPEKSDQALLPPSAALDEVFTQYLKLARALGAPQSGDGAVDVTQLVQAARALRDQTKDEDARRVAAALTDRVAAFSGQPIERQRQLFRDMSEALIAIARSSKLSSAVASKLYVMRCPMAPGTWIQDQPEIANPYYATEMKSCGDLLETLDLPAKEDQ